MRDGFYYFKKIEFDEECTIKDVEKKYKKALREVYPDSCYAHSMEVENNVRAFVFFEEPTKSDLSEAEENNWIILELDQDNKFGMLHGCTTEPDFTEKRPLWQFSMRVNAAELKSITDVLETREENARIELFDEQRKEIVSFAKKHGRKTLYEAQSERYASLINTYKNFSNPHILEIYKAAKDELTLYAVLMCEAWEHGLEAQCGIAQKIVGCVHMLVDEQVEKLIVWYEEGKVTASTIESFMRASLKLIREYSHYLLFYRKDLINNCPADQIISFISEALKIVFNVYASYLTNEIEVTVFDKGEFMLSVLIDGTIENNLTFVRYLRYIISTLDIREIRKLNELHKRRFQDAMFSPEGMLSLSISPLCLTLVELSLEDESFLLSLIEPNHDHYKYIEILLTKEGASKITLLSSNGNPKSEALKNENVKKQKRRKDLDYIHCESMLSPPLKLEDKQIENILLDENEFNEALKPNEKNTSAINQLLAESPYKGTMLIIDYLYCEQKRLLQLLGGFHKTIAEKPNIIKSENIESIKKRLCILESKSISLLKYIVLILFKRYIYQGYVVNRARLEKNNTTYLEDLLWYMIDASSEEVRVQLKFPYIDIDTNSQSARKFIFEFSRCINSIANPDLSSSGKISPILKKIGAINKLPFSRLELKAIEVLRQINKLFAIYLPKELNEENKLQTPLEIVNKYLDNLANKSYSLEVIKPKVLELEDETEKFNEIIQAVNEITKNYRSLSDLVTKSKDRSPTKKLILSWEKKWIELLRDYGDLRSKVYRSDYAKALADICKMTQDDRDMLNVLCKNSIESGAIFSVNKLKRLFEGRDDISKIEKLLPPELLKQADSKLDNHSFIDVEHIKSLEACLVALTDLNSLDLVIKVLKVHEKLAHIKKDFHQKQYYEYLAYYKKWLAYGVGTYQSLQETLVNIKKRDNDFIKNFSSYGRDGLRHHIGISYDNNTDQIKNQIVDLKEKQRLVDQAEIACPKLLECIGHGFFELRHFHLEMTYSAVKMIPSVTSNMSLKGSLEARRARLSMLAKNAKLEVIEITAIDFPNDEEFAAIEEKLKNFLHKGKEYSASIKRIKKKIKTCLDELSRLARIHENKSIEYQLLSEEHSRETREFTQLHNCFVSLFDTALIVNDDWMVPKLLERLKNVRSEFKGFAFSNLIDTLRDKSKKLIFLKNRLYELGETGLDDTHITRETIEAFDPIFNKWSEEIYSYLDKHIDLLLNESRYLLDKLIKLKIGETSITVNVNEQLQNFITFNESLKSKYDGIIELITHYESFGVSLSFGKSKLSDFCDSLLVNEETIDAINNILSQQKNNTTQNGISKGLIQIEKNKLIDENNKPSCGTKKKLKQKSKFSLVKEYQKKFDSFAQKISDISCEIHRLELEANVSKTTINKRLPTISLEHTREGLKVLLERKISSLKGQIGSYAEIIASLRTEGAGLVHESLNKIIQPSNQKARLMVDRISSIIASENCSRLSLSKENERKYILSINTVNELLSFTIHLVPGALEKNLELLFVAVKGQNSLLSSDWCANQTGFIIDRLDKFLNSISVAHQFKYENLSEDPFYAETLGRIINITQIAKNKIQSFALSRYDAFSLKQKSQQFSEFENILFDLDNTLNSLINSFNRELWLAFDLQKYNVFQIRTMLINIIHERRQRFDSISGVGSMSDRICLSPISVSPPPHALVMTPSYAQNPSCLFASAPVAPINPTVAYCTVNPLAP